MADTHAQMSRTTPRQVLLSIVLGLIAPLIAIVLILSLIKGIQNRQVDADKPEAAAQAVLKNIAPVAGFEAVDTSAAKVVKSGEEIYNAVCVACHTPGVAGAPKLGDKAAWGARISQGFDLLVKHAVEGFTGKTGMMPAKGGAADLSDDEVARVVAYMANQAGANFKAPEPAQQAAAAPAAPAADGKAVYGGTCALCHGAGMAGAPKFGDKAAWGPRIAQGNDILYKHALEGFTGKAGMMPARGGNTKLADAEVKAAVDYMVNQAK